MSGKAGAINLLIDLNGTCHIGDTPTRRAVRAIEKLRAAQRDSGHRINIRFCSNTTKESTPSLLQKLRRASFGAELIEETDLFTSLDAARQLVKRSNLSPLLLLSESASSAFRADESVASRCFFATPSQTPDKLPAHEKQHLQERDAVIIGLCPELMTQAWLDEAFRLIAGEYNKKKPAKLIATHRAMYHQPSGDAKLSLGPGAFVTALESAARLDSASTTVCGKPSASFLQECLAGMRTTSDDETNIIIGDDMDADLGGGTIELGLKRILVRTGKYRAGDEDRSAKPPDQTFDTFADWVDDFLSTLDR